MAELIFLTLDEVIEIHEQQIERYGGSSRLRDPGALESAVAMPQSTFAGEYLHSSIPAMAAAYLFHLCQNHASLTATSASVQTPPSRSADERLGAAVRRTGTG